MIASLKLLVMSSFFKFIFLSTIATTFLLGNWEMFSDGSDTYIYNKITGEIYIRYRLGGENFKDEFIKMPHGKSSNESLGDANTNFLPLTNTKKSKEELALEAQKLERRAFDAMFGNME